MTANRAGAVRVIFLDVDGVCNSLASLFAFQTYRRFDDVALGLLQRAAIELDAYFVLSSAWRICGHLSACKAIFIERKADVIATRMIDMTDDEMGKRGEQIARWLAANAFPEYAIIDDDSDMLPEQMPRFVKTDHRTGFRIAEYVKLRTLFTPNDSEVRSLQKTLDWQPTPRAETLDWQAEESADILLRIANE